MKKFLFKTLKNKLLFWFLIIALTPLLTLIIYSYFQQVNDTTNGTIEKVTAIRDLKVKELNKWLIDIRGDINMMSQDYEIRSLDDHFTVELKAPKHMEQQIAVEKLLNRSLLNYNRYEEIFIVNVKTGLVEASTNRHSVGRDESHNPCFKIPLATKEPYLEEIHLSPITKKPEMTFSAPIICLSHNKHISGILVTTIDLPNTVYKLMLDKVGLGQTGESLIINKNGIALNELRWYKNAQLNLKIKALPAVLAVQGKTGIIKTSDYRGVKVLAAYTNIPQTGWGFVVKQDMSELNIPIHNVMRRSAILFILFTVVVVFIILNISKSISKPITVMDSIAKKIAKGNFNNKTITNTPNEIGSLAISINHMSEVIQSKNNIEKGVTAISAILFSQTAIDDFAVSLLNELTKISKAQMAVFYILNEANQTFETLTCLGVEKEFLTTISAASPKDQFGKTLLKKNIFYLKDFPEKTVFNTKANTSKFKALSELITCPIVIENEIAAFVTLAKSNPFTKEFMTIINQSSKNISAFYASLIVNLRVGILAENVLKINDALDAQTENLRTRNSDLINEKLKVEEVNKELEAFSYSVSHDLRAPLRHIDGFTNLLQKSFANKMDEKEKSHFKNIIDSSLKMNQLIDGLLIYSRTGRSGLKKVSSSMKTLVDKVIQTFVFDIKEKNVLVTVDAMPDAFMDAFLLAQVWENLIANAIKFSSNTKNPKIHIGYNTDAEGNSIYFIKDNGAGFDQKYAEKAFGVFQRLHTTNEFQGTGIGLATAKRIITKHQGAIWAEGKINKGASFFFKLPIN
jgi:signal transduction histidine kinase/HAMP domain-containing protein